MPSYLQWTNKPKIKGKKKDNAITTYSVIEALIIVSKGNLRELDPLDDISQLVAMTVLEVDRAPVRPGLGDGIGEQLSGM